MTDTVDLVRKVPMFAGLDDDEMAWVAGLATEFDVPAGFVLIEHGQPGSGMFIITDGTISIEVPRGALERGPGEFVGELALLVVQAFVLADLLSDFREVRFDSQVGASPLHWPVVARNFVAAVAAEFAN